MFFHEVLFLCFSRKVIQTESNHKLCLTYRWWQLWSQLTSLWVLLPLFLFLTGSVAVCSMPGAFQVIQRLGQSLHAKPGVPPFAPVFMSFPSHSPASATMWLFSWAEKRWVFYQRFRDTESWWKQHKDGALFMCWLLFPGLGFFPKTSFPPLFTF